MEVVFQSLMTAGVAAGSVGVTAAAPNPAVSCFDPQAIDDLLSLEKNSPGLLCSLTRQFLSDSRELITRLNGGTPASAKEIEFAAHALKSTCALFGARHVTELASRVECAVRRGDLAAARRLAAETGAEFTRFENELRSHTAIASALI